METRLRNFSASKNFSRRKSDHSKGFTVDALQDPDQGVVPVVVKEEMSSDPIVEITDRQAGCQNNFGFSQ